ncbi:MAG: D-alanyl-D-alanine carboxypeptidase [Ruminococcus sp.]|nr:D-alanyl-D-alanine carboxypeptidase [Ruminococcus sp.]
MIPASSFVNDVETTTADMLLINLDTNTIVYSQKPDNMWYAGYLSELVTFLVAYEMIPDPEKATYKPEASFSASLPHSDGSLNQFIGVELTAKDLMAIMLLTSGNDAAYALADLSSDGDRKAFVEAMNEKVEILGCKNTGFVSPGYDSTSNQYTTCRDLYNIYMEVRKNEFFNEVMEADPLSYIPSGLKSDDEEENKKYTVYPEASIINDKSPYYFRYTNDAKISHTEATYADLVLTATYRGKTYFFAGLLGKMDSEENIYADARKLLTWAYLNLSDRKMINSEEAMAEVNVAPDWGEYPVDLHPFNSAFKTLPNDYDESKLSYELDIPESVQTPIAEGQAVGRAKLFYDGDEIDDIQLIVNSDEGLDMLPDMGRFTSYIYHQLMPYQLSTDQGAEGGTATEAKAPESPEKPAPTGSLTKATEQGKTEG